MSDALLRRFADRATAALSGAGGAPFRAGAEVKDRPSSDQVIYFVLHESESDGTSTLIVQVDTFGKPYTRARALENLVRASFKALRNGLEIDGLRVTAQLGDARDHQDGEAGQAHRSFDITLTSAWTG